MSKLSPMMQQYLKIKALHQDHILFFRLGDFYEMFFEDAQKVSKELELTLTGKDCGLPQRAPMCGIPYHSSTGYIKKLIDKGYKVAICEQTEDPTKARGLVNRDVIRIITPGTLIEGDLLEEAKNNYIASFYVQGNYFTACFADISTGEVSLTTQKSHNLSMDLINELSKFMPVEVLYNEEFIKQPEIPFYLSHKLNCTQSPFEKEQIDFKRSQAIILEHFQIDSIDSLGIDHQETTCNALAGLIAYLNQTQKQGAKRITCVSYYQEDQYMNIDFTARRNLEITQTIRSQEKRGTLLWVIDKTKTSMGKRFIRKALEQPLLNAAQIIRRQDAVAELVENHIILSELQSDLSGIHDLERLMTRVIYNTINPRELRSLAATAAKLPNIKQNISGFCARLLKGIYGDIHTLDDVANLIENAIVEEPPVAMKEGGYIQTGFHSELDNLRNLRDNAKNIIGEIENRERENTKIKGLKIKYNRVFGYYIEVTNANLSHVPDHYIRKQTLVNCERFITQELKELEEKILTANDKIIALESEIFHEVRQYIASRTDIIQKTAQAISKLDFLISLAFVAIQNHYVRPQIVLDGRIDIKEGRHPVVEQMLNDTPFVPNDIYLDHKDNQLLVITGPNMAGKSTYMRQVALMNIMAQIGSFVPAQSACISIVDKIFTRVGASDDLAAGQSTFMVEMSEVAHILKFATSKSLVILDEIGRGTSTFDGMSIAKAVAEYLVCQTSLKCKALFATHYHELTCLEQELSGVKNYNIAVKKRGDDITFLRKIVPGGADDSFGIEVAKLAGVPEQVISRAKEILSQLEQGNLKPQPAVTKTKNTQKKDKKYQQLEQILCDISIDTLTPIEALNTLYRLKKLVSQ